MPQKYDNFGLWPRIVVSCETGRLRGHLIHRKSDVENVEPQADSMSSKSHLGPPVFRRTIQNLSVGDVNSVMQKDAGEGIDGES